MRYLVNTRNLHTIIQESIGKIFQEMIQKTFNTYLSSAYYTLLTVLNVGKEFDAVF